MRKRLPLPSQARLKELILYDPQSGRFSSLETGRPIGHFNNKLIRSKPCWYISIDRVNYLASRLAWVYMTGEEPDEVDHIDRDPSNNRWSNLRNVSRYENEINKGAYRNSKTGIKGVFLGPDGKFRVAIQRRHKRIKLGTFLTIAEAAAAYQEASQ